MDIMTHCLAKVVVVLSPAPLVFALIGCSTKKETPISELPEARVDPKYAKAAAGELLAGQSFGQTFQANRNGLTRVEALVAIYTKPVPSGALILHLRSGPDEATDIATGSVAASSIKDNSYVSLHFAPIGDSAGKSYYLFLEARDILDGYRVTVWRSDEEVYPHGSFYVNHQPQPYDLVFETFYVTREDYQAERLDSLRRLTDLRRAEGLEIGVCDLPTVSPGVGNCEYADYRSQEEMISLFNLKAETVVPVRYLLRRDRKVSQQINKLYDYIVLCHVIEHVPNPIGYVQDLSLLLKNNGLLFIACPDKRRTPDNSRCSTTVAHLLDDLYHNCTYPSLEHILEHTKAWLKDEACHDAEGFYAFGRAYLESGGADAHCHVWADEEFFEQMDYFIKGKVLRGLGIVQKLYNKRAFNEFILVLGKHVSPA